MKKFIVVALALFTLGGISFWAYETDTPNKHEVYGKWLQNHPYSKRAAISEAEMKAMPKKDRPDLAFEQNFLMTLDPALGYPTPERLKSAYADIQRYQRKKTTPLLVWEERGPFAVGGRTRALMYDPNDPTGTKVWAGGVTGGLWFNNDLRSSSSIWQTVSNTWSNLSVSAMDYDPTNTQTFYVGTGEGLSNSLSYGHGTGIWKSTDAGATWAIIPGTENMTSINDLVVRDENGVGVLYVAVRNRGHQGFNANFTIEGLYRSTDGGATFTQVMPNVNGTTYSHAPADLEIGPDNRLWVGTINSNNATTQNDGGSILYSDDGQNFTLSYNINASRVDLAVAPSNKDYIYALVERSGTVYRIMRSIDGGANWTSMPEPADADPGISNGDFSRGQAWYDLIVQVDPNDEATVVVGGINLHRSVDTANTWQQVSHWYGGFGFPYVHADIHQLIYKPGSSIELLIGSDGGVARSRNFANFSPSFSDRNRGYNVTQFYAGALHPDAGVDYFLAGAQDNGTQQFTQPGLAFTSEATGGDGAFCFIDKDNPSFQITSSQFSNFRRSFNGGNSFSSLYDGDNGRFINPADYDDNLNILYAARSFLTIARVSNADGSEVADNFRLRDMFELASAFKVSPYTTASSTLFVGSGAGKLFKVEHADEQSGTLNPIDITGPNFPAGYISSIDIGSTEDELLVTFSNYGLASVWYTNDGGLTWVDVEGNLPDMPIRGVIFNPRDRKVVALATEMGVWMTQDITAANPVWVPANDGFANVRVDMIEVRESDYTIMATTHGRGVFTSRFESGIGLAENNAKPLVSLYPNPASRYLNFDWQEASAEPWQVKLIDLTGRIRLEATMPSKNSGSEQLSLTQLAPGNYLVQASSGNIVYNTKIIVL
jgi:photosystem II stability/assembly factor-like uncharacterized protein